MLRTAMRLMGTAGDLPETPAGPPLACLATAREIFEAESMPHGMASCDFLAADIFAANGDMERALELAELSLPLLEVEIDAELVGRGWHNQGIRLHRLGQTEAALHAHEVALEAYRVDGRAVPTADCHVGIGMALVELSRAEDALGSYADARALYREFGAWDLLADVDDRRGLALTELGRYEEAVLAHGAAVDRYLSLGREWHAATGAALLGMGHGTAARPLLDSARRMLASYGLDGEAEWCERVRSDPAELVHRHPER
jgi:tetratricopeptide (TPR) repeat protein